MAKKGIISLGKANIYIFLIFVPIIFRYCLSFAESQSKFYSGDNSHPILYTLNYSLGLCLSFFLLIIYKRNIKINDKEYNLSTTDNNNNEDPPIQIKQITATEKYVWILLVSFIDFTIRILSSIYWLNLDNYLIIGHLILFLWHCLVI